MDFDLSTEEKMKRKLVEREEKQVKDRTPEQECELCKFYDTSTGKGSPKELIFEKKMTIEEYKRWIMERD
jgi:hypothetical protein